MGNTMVVMILVESKLNCLKSEISMARTTLASHFHVQTWGHLYCHCVVITNASQSWISTMHTWLENYYSDKSDSQIFIWNWPPQFCLLNIWNILKWYPSGEPHLFCDGGAKYALDDNDGGIRDDCKDPWNLCTRYLDLSLSGPVTSGLRPKLGSVVCIITKVWFQLH